MHSFPYRSTRRGTSTDPSIASHEPMPFYSWPQLLSAVLSASLGLASLVLCVVFFKMYGGGFHLEGPYRFNLHPLCMVIALPLLLTWGLLSWRLMPLSHLFRKLLHLFFNVSAASFVAAGLYFIFTTKNGPHVVSVHSWLGLAAALLLGLQLLFGLSVFLFPLIPLSFRRFSLPLHATWGVLVYVLSLLALLSGLTNLLALQSSKWGWGSNTMTLGDVLGITVLGALFFALYAILPRRDPAAEISKLEEEEREGGGRGALRRAAMGTGGSGGSAYYAGEKGIEAPTLGSAYGRGTMQGSTL